MKKLIYLLILISLFAQAQNNGNGNANGSGGNGGNDDSPHVFKNNTQGFVYKNLGNSFVTSCGITDKFMQDTINEAVKNMKALDDALRQLGDERSKCNSINSGSAPLSSTIDALGELSKKDGGVLNWKKHAASVGPQATPALLDLIRPEKQIGQTEYNELNGFRQQLDSGATLDKTQQARFDELQNKFDAKSRENALLYAGAQMGATVTNLVATGCLKELFGKSQNSTPAASKVLNTLGTFGEVGSNIMMNVSGIVPTLAPFALGIKLASAGFRAIGSLIEKRRPVNKQTFHRKTCAFKNYLETRAKAKCINGCDEKIESIKKAITETQTFKDGISCKTEIDSLDKNIADFIVDFDEHVKKLPTIQNIDNEPLKGREFSNLRNMIAKDQARLEKEMGLDGSDGGQNLENLLMVDGDSKKILKKHNLKKEPYKTLLSKVNKYSHLKEQVDLMTSPAGVAMSFFCGHKDGQGNFSKPLKNKFFKDNFGIKDQETINKDCNTIRGFTLCFDLTPDSNEMNCPEVKKFADKSAHEIDRFVSKGTLNLLNNLNYYRLNNELGHDDCKFNPSPSSCISMHKFAVKGPVTHAYSHLTSGNLNLGFSSTEKDDPLYANYSKYRKKVFERDHKIRVETKTYNDYINLASATSELSSLQKLAAVDLAKDDGDALDKEVKAQAEKKLDHCFGTNDTEIITQLNGGTELDEPDTESSPGTTFESNWKDFFKYETASADDTPITDDSGNFGVALSKVLKGNSPWTNEDKIEGEDMAALQKQTCGNLYCAVKANLDDFQSAEFKKSNFVKGTRNTKSKILKECEDIMGEDFQCDTSYCQSVMAKVENDINKLNIFTPGEEGSWSEKLEKLKACIEE